MSVASSETLTDEQQILALHEAGDRALMSADLTALAEIFADDSVQYNDAGVAFTKTEILETFSSGAIRYRSIVSIGRKIRVLGDTAVVHGSKDDEVETNGQRRKGALLVSRCSAEVGWEVEVSGRAVGAGGGRVESPFLG